MRLTKKDIKNAQKGAIQVISKLFPEEKEKIRQLYLTAYYNGTPSEWSRPHLSIAIRAEKKLKAKMKNIIEQEEFKEIIKMKAALLIMSKKLKQHGTI